MVQSGYRLGDRTVEVQFGGGHLAGAELVLEPLHRESVQSSVPVAQFQVEHRQAFSAGPVALRPGEGEGHVGGHGRCEPLPAIEPPAAIGALPRLRERPADVRAAGGLGHPLAAGPEAFRIPRREAGQCAIGQTGISGVQKRTGGAVSHGQRARVDVAGGMKQVHERELQEPFMAAHGVLFVSGGYQAMFRRNIPRAMPERRDLHRVDPVAPGIPAHKARLAEPVRQLHVVELTARQPGHRAEARARLRKERLRHTALDPFPQPRVRDPRIRQPWAVLRKEFHVRYRSC